MVFTSLVGAMAEFLDLESLVVNPLVLLFPEVEGSKVRFPGVAESTAKHYLGEPQPHLVTSGQELMAKCLLSNQVLATTRQFRHALKNFKMNKKCHKFRLQINVI